MRFWFEKGLTYFIFRVMFSRSISYVTGLLSLYIKSLVVVVVVVVAAAAAFHSDFLSVSLLSLSQFMSQW